MHYLIIILILVIILFYITHDPTEKLDNFDYIYTPGELFRHLDYISYILSINNIKHWLMYGTLLGAVRQGDIIPYDYDFDLGAHVEDVDKLLALSEQLDYDGYKFERSFVYDNSTNKNLWKVSLKIYYKRIPMGDIYLYKKCGDGLMRRYDPITGMYFWPKGTFPSWFIDDLATVKVRNGVYPMPRDAKILLEYFYGKTWRTPIKAKAQGGQGSKDSDYYGGDLNNKLSFLLDYIKKKKGIILKPKIEERIKYIEPKDQIKWIQDNEK